jgi:hypothetical protein
VTVLKQCQATLRELCVLSGDPHFDGEPPASAYVAHLACTTAWLAQPAVLARWLVDVDVIRTIAINAPGPSARTHGAFFGHGEGSFCFTPDCKRVLINWLVGPLFGQGCVCDLAQLQDGTFCLTNEHLQWIL